MKLYLSGPMTGLPDYNYPAFHAAAAALRTKGHKVFSPAESFEGNQDLPHHVYMRKDLKALLKAEGIVLLEGWGKSKGARLELRTALALGLQVFFDWGEADDLHEVGYFDATLFLDSAEYAATFSKADAADTDCDAAPVGFGLTHGIEATLRERGERYGVFAEQAAICQSLKHIMALTDNWFYMADDQRECLDAIAGKISRILNGDFNYPDNYHDIAGYATLVLNRLTAEQTS